MATWTEEGNCRNMATWTQKHIDGSELLTCLNSAVENAGSLVWRNDELKKEIEIEMSKRLRLEKENRELKEMASRLREERDGLCNILKEKEDDQNEIIQLKRKICELECDKLKAKTDVDLSQKRIKELEGRILMMNVEKDASGNVNLTISGKRKASAVETEENTNPSDELIPFAGEGTGNDFLNLTTADINSDIYIDNDENIYIDNDDNCYGPLSPEEHLLSTLFHPNTEKGTGDSAGAGLVTITATVL
ncbi:uncharacterized protein [Euphorbia lathyris]|uniref:uncharacterized protein isoform X2 n=1 Tax=Euphorbia lathyris TaxID=212925 RepID=UPI003313F8D6